MRADRAGQSALLFLDVVEILQREKVDYAVIGAFALSVHGAMLEAPGPHFIHYPGAVLDPSPHRRGDC